MMEATPTPKTPRTGERISLQHAIDAGLRHLNEGKLPDAAALANAILRSRPRNPLALAILGEVSRRQGRYAQAEKYLKASLAENDHDVMAHRSLGASLRKLNRNEEAIECYRRVLSLDDSRWVDHRNLGNALYAAEQFEEAIAAYRSGLDRGPKNAELYYSLGTALLAAGRTEEAGKAYIKALAINPEHAQCHCNLGKVFIDQQRFTEGVASFRRALKYQPKFFAAMVNEVTGLISGGECGEALEACNRYLLEYPGNTFLIALKCVALRELERNNDLTELLDFDRFIKASVIRTPTGYDSLEAFNRDLVNHIIDHPTLKTDPRMNATRSGQHTGDLLQGEVGPVGALRDEIDAAVERYRQSLPMDRAHPFLADPPQRTRMVMWAVVLGAGGHQIPHIHPGAWLSGVYYAQVPEVVQEEDETHAGWIEFGRPLPEHRCKKEPLLRMIKPEESKVILFPSYFYHRTVPFDSNGRRVSIAFDLIRAQ